MTIEQITLRHLRLPLTVPYKLSLAVIRSFDTLLVEMRDGEDRIGYGEATLLQGYTEETLESAWREISRSAERIAGQGFEAARAMITPMQPRAPFSATALMTAVEMLERNSLLSPPSGAKVPLLAPINADSGEALDSEVDALLTAGYRTLKVKVGFDVATDLARVRRIQETVAGRAMLRLDANQGFSREAGCRFVGELDPEGIELVEQTCAAGDWDAAAAVAKVAPVPMMLDESIYGIADVELAAELGCATYIKFKLMKAGGLAALARALERIRELGMTPVLGNGVAADIGCWMEACVAHAYIDNAGEMNGFLKPRTGILREPLEVGEGAVMLPPGYPSADSGKLAAVTAAERSFS